MHQLVYVKFDYTFMVNNGMAIICPKLQSLNRSLKKNPYFKKFILTLVLAKINVKMNFLK